MEWWFIRHGFTKWNKERRYQGHSDTELLPGSASGLEALKEGLAETTFSAVYCSDLGRCRSTLDYVRPDLTAVARYDNRLREMNFGIWEGQTYEMLKDDVSYRNWIDNPQAVSPPGGETWPEFEERVREIYEELTASSKELAANGEDDPLLIVTHGGVISLLATWLIPGSDFWNAGVKIAPGEVLKLVYEGTTAPKGHICPNDIRRK